MYNLRYTRKYAGAFRFSGEKRPLEPPEKFMFALYRRRIYRSAIPENIRS